MNKLKFMIYSIAQNFALAVAYMATGLIEAKEGFCNDMMDYHTYRVLKSRKVFKN